MGRSEAELPGVEASWWSSGISNRDLGKITGCNRGKWCSERRRQIHLTLSSGSPGVPFLFYFFLILVIIKNGGFFVCFQESRRYKLSFRFTSLSYSGQNVLWETFNLCPPS